MTRNHRRARTRVTAFALALTLAALLPACGSNPESPAYSKAVARQLQADAAHVRAAAEQRRIREARRALHALTRHVAQAQAQGKIPTRRARLILRAVDRIAADLTALPDPTPRPDRPQWHDDRDPPPERGHGPPEERDEPPDENGGKPEGWEVHKGEEGKPEGWEAHKNEE